MAAGGHAGHVAECHPKPFRVRVQIQKGDVMSELKHFQFDGFKGLRGRFAMRLSGDLIEMQPLAGNAPRPEHVLKAVAQMPELVGAINVAIPTRRNLYTIDRRVGMSGAVDVRLREHRDEMWADYPVRAVVHISMYGKLNQGFRLWVGDFGALFAHIWAQDVDFSEQSLDVSIPRSGSSSFGPGWCGGVWCRGTSFNPSFGFIILRT